MKKGLPLVLLAAAVGAGIYLYRRSKSGSTGSTESTGSIKNQTPVKPLTPAQIADIKRAVAGRG